MRSNLKWLNEDEDLGWIYCGAGDDVKKEFVQNIINEHFTEIELYVAHERNNSFLTTKDNVIAAIKNILGKENFAIWDKSFNKVVDFNKIGVLRIGKKPDS